MYSSPASSVSSSTFSSFESDTLSEEPPNSLPLSIVCSLISPVSLTLSLSPASTVLWAVVSSFLFLQPAVIKSAEKAATITTHESAAVATLTLSVNFLFNKSSYKFLSSVLIFPITLSLSPVTTII